MCTTMYRNHLKRLFDVVASFILLVAVSPLLLFTACWLMLSNRSSDILFFQKRPGKNGIPFRMIKFKTMTDERDKKGALLSDEIRITKTGRFIRSGSIDELLQLFNVLKGDMSLVGPRPLLVEYLPLYDKTQARRHDVRPGITGWAQVNGRNGISWAKKFEYDVWYVDHLNLWLDVKILFMTLKKVVKRNDIDAVDSFMGKES